MIMGEAANREAQGSSDETCLSADELRPLPPLSTFCGTIEIAGEMFQAVITRATNDEREGRDDPKTAEATVQTNKAPSHALRPGRETWINQQK